MKSYFNLKLISLLALTVFGLLPSTVSAITLSPTRFEVSGNPGDTLEYELSIINESQNTENYFIDFANFEASGETGDPAFTLPEEGLGTWIKVPSKNVGVGPQEEKKIPFKIEIPQNATPGGYFAVIFLGNQSSEIAGRNVGVGSQAGVLVLLSVLGDVKEQAGVFDFNTKNKQFFYKTLPVNFEYRLKNEGGDRVKSVGKIRIHNTLFIPTERIDANPSNGNVLPGSTRKFNVTWLEYEKDKNERTKDNFFGKFWDNAVYEWKNFALGFYTANLKVVHGVNETRTSDFTFFFVFPWELVILLLIAFIIIYFIGKKLIIRYNRYIIEKARNSFNSQN
jgi:hypothetical protein